MNKRNFNLEFENIVNGIINKGEKKKLLLHSCCAPCSSACLERLKDAFDVIVYYYNPNLDTEKEFNLRAKEQQRLCDDLSVKCIVEEFNKAEFLDVVKGLENEKEGGARCVKCFDLRLKRTAEKAKELDCDYFCTTLTISPLKNAQQINSIGERLEREIGQKYLVTDFKKKGGYLRSIELSKEYDLYRQNYCGCEFSKSSLL